MVKLYVRDISILFDGAWAQFVDRLPDARRRQVLRSRRDHDRARSVGSWLLLREAFAQEGMDIDGRPLEKGAHGKPFFRDCPAFSLSHAGIYAAVAVSDDPVGVDIETARCTMALARRFFAPSEITAAEALAGDAQKVFLQRLWVAKEAFVKALGTGLTTPLDSFIISPGSDSVTLTQNLTPLPIRLTEFTEDAYRIAVAGTETATRIETAPFF